MSPIFHQDGRSAKDVQEGQRLLRDSNTSPSSDIFRERGIRLIREFLPIFNEHCPVMVIPKPTKIIVEMRPLQVTEKIACIAIYFAREQGRLHFFENQKPFEDFAEYQLAHLASELRQKVANGLRIDTYPPREDTREPNQIAAVSSRVLQRLRSSPGTLERAVKSREVPSREFLPLIGSEEFQNIRTLVSNTLSFFNFEMISRALDIPSEERLIAIELENFFNEIYPEILSQGLIKITNGLSEIVDQALDVKGAEGLRSNGLNFYLQCLAENNPAQIKNRAFWMQSFPFFAEIEDQHKFKEVVANQEPFIPLAARAFSCSPALIRRVAQMQLLNSSQMADRLRHWPIDEFRGELLSFLDAGPIHKVPFFDSDQFPEEATRFIELVTTLGEFTKNYPYPIRCKIMSQIGRSAEGRWDLLEKVSTKDKLKEVTDFIQMVAQATVLPWLSVTEPKLESTQFRSLSKVLSTLMLLQEIPLVTLVRLSDDWHRVVGRDNTRNLLSHRSWKPLCDTQVTPDGLIIVPLVDSAELIAEGQQLHHCVGGYASKCLLGTNHIFSIRSLEGARLSTLQLSSIITDGVGTVSLVQHKTAWNQSTTTALDNAAGWLIDQINSGVVAVDWAALAQASSRRELNEIVGFDVSDRQLWDKIYQAMIPFLPKKLRYETVEKFIANTHYREFRESL